jgi:hypothetical protein
MQNASSINVESCFVLVIGTIGKDADDRGISKKKAKRLNYELLALRRIID